LIEDRLMPDDWPTTDERRGREVSKAMLPSLSLVVPTLPETRGVDVSLPFGKRSLLTWTLQTARQASAVDRLVVVTDDPRISELAWNSGAETVASGPRSGDQPETLESITLHVLDVLEHGKQFRAEFIIFLDPAFPLRKASDIDGAVNLVRSRGADSVFSATPLSGLVWRRREGEWISVDHDYHDEHRYDVPSDSVAENGVIYAVRPRVLQRTNNRIGGKIVVYRTPMERSWPICSEADVAVAERLLVPS
jgi:CMP-N,N'-diacetyllegionaminic acid synthase